MKPPPRVLVIRGGAIGDFILTLPVLRLLREMIPNCHLEVMGYLSIATLAQSAGLANDVRSLDHRTMAALFAKNAPIDEALAEHLRSFNLVVSYLFDPDGYFRGNLERLGVKTLIECPHRILPGQGPAATQLARPLEKIALFLEHSAPHFPVPPDLPSPTTPTHFILHPGSGSTQKTWPLENWLSVLQSLAQTQPLHIVLITGEAEAERGLLPTLKNLSHPNLTFESWHQIPLPNLVPRLQSLAPSGTRFLGHDSGISHLAAACGLPCTLLFGPTDPTLWAPQNPNITLLTSPTDKLTDLPPQTLLHSLLHQ